jgi:hypothetical protein
LAKNVIIIIDEIVIVRGTQLTTFPNNGRKREPMVMEVGEATKYGGRAMPIYIVIVTFSTALGKSPTITLILPGVVAKLHTSVVGLLSVAAKLPTLKRLILGPLSSNGNMGCMESR